MGGGGSKPAPGIKVVVLGGGYGGSAVVKSLAGKVNLTLVEVRFDTSFSPLAFLPKRVSSHHQLCLPFAAIGPPVS